MRIGLLFSGQGSQYPGMGSDLYDNYSVARSVFDEAGEDIKGWCFGDDKEILMQTHVTQPTVLTVSLAAYQTLIDQLRKNDVDFEIVGMAGFSMGEYGALTAARSFTDTSSTLDLITKRSQFMAEAGTDDNGNPKGAMAAVIGDRQKVKECVDELHATGVLGNDAILEAVNFNTPSQTVVAGDIDSIRILRERGKQEYKLKVIPLKVSSAFHSSMMVPAVAKLERVLNDVEISAPETTVYTNTTGEDIMKEKPEEIDAGVWIRETLTKQVKNPVFWQETIENMARDGVDVFVEVGPGKTLSGFATKTLKDAAAFSVEDSDGIKAIVDFLSTSS